MTGFMEFPLVEGEVLKHGQMAEGVGNAPTSARADPVFKTGAASLYLPAFQNGQGSRSCTCELLVANPAGAGLLTLNPENGCQTWTRTKTSGLTGRRATLTLPGNGAAAGFPPASFRLEDGCLMYSTTAAI
jgi:hypothetical protein